MSYKIYFKGPHKTSLKLYKNPDIIDSTINISTDNLNIINTLFNYNQVKLINYGISHSLIIEIVLSRTFENNASDTIILDFKINNKELLSKIFKLDNNILTIIIENCNEYILLNNNENSFYYVDINENDIPINSLKLVYTLNDKSKKLIEKFLMKKYQYF
jgi:hypothetical protein